MERADGHLTVGRGQTFEIAVVFLASRIFGRALP